MAFKPHLFKYLKASKECSPCYLLPLLLLRNTLYLLDAFHSEKLDSRRLAVVMDNMNSPIHVVLLALELKKCHTFQQQVNKFEVEQPKRELL